MLTALKILGVIALLFLLLLVLAAAWLWRKFRAVAQALQTPSTPPCRVALEPEPDPQWRSPEIIQRFAAEFRELGFAESGAFHIPELGGLQLRSFVHPAERYAAVIYDHTKIAPTFDIVCEFEDGTELSATNTTMGDTLDKRPGHTTLWLGDVNVREVFEAVQQHPQPSPRIPVRGDEFAAKFQKSYAKGMNWRLKKGGSSREEIRRQVEKDGTKLEDEQFEEVYANLREGYLRELQAGCIAQYLDDQQLAAADWERLRSRVFAIPETMELKELIEALEGQLDLDAEQTHQLAKLEKPFGETAVDVMNRILEQNIGALGLEKLGEVTEPVRALILISPVDKDDELEVEEPVK